MIPVSSFAAAEGTPVPTSAGLSVTLRSPRRSLPGILDMMMMPLPLTPHPRPGTASSSCTPTVINSAGTPNAGTPRVELCLEEMGELNRGETLTDGADLQLRVVISAFCAGNGPSPVPKGATEPIRVADEIKFHPEPEWLQRG